MQPPPLLLLLLLLLLLPLRPLRPLRPLLLRWRPWRRWRRKLLRHAARNAAGHVELEPEPTRPLPSALERLRGGAAEGEGDVHVGAMRGTEPRKPQLAYVEVGGVGQSPRHEARLDLAR
jgi:hypothetical protein